MTELSRLGYERVRGQLIDVAKEYFAYLKVDKTLPTDERERVIKRDVAIFMGLSKVYRDEKTTAYLEGLLEEESISQTSKPSVNGGNKNLVRRRPKPLTLEARTQAPKVIAPENDLSDFVPLNTVYRELKVDEEMLKYVSDNIRIEIETKTIKGKEVKGITNRTYSAIKREVKRLRS